MLFPPSNCEPTGLLFCCLQFVLNAAQRLVFIITENRYKGALDGSVPVLVQSVSSYAHICHLHMLKVLNRMIVK